MNIAEKFHQFETSFDLNKFTVDGLWYYPIVKMAVYFELAGRNNIAASGNMSGISAGKQILRQFIWGIKWKFKSRLPHSVKYLFVDNALTRRKTESGYFENLYLGPVMDALGEEQKLLFEYPSIEFGHYSQIDTDYIDFPDWDIFKIFLKAKFKTKKIAADQTPVKALYEFFGLIYNSRFVKDRLYKTFLFKAFFRKYLAKIRPQIIFLIDGYDYKQMSLIHAAKELQIPTVELQHGLINESHMAYIYHKVESRQLFPDYLLTFGDYFRDLILRESAVWNNDSVVSVGFPYIEKVKDGTVKLPDKLKNLAQKYFVIYVTSQWTVRNELRTFILGLSKILDNGYRIFYKIHPGEKDAENFYQSLAGKQNIELIFDKTVNSMEIMKVADVHSTVYSTSFFESTCFGLPNIFIEVAGYTENIKNYINSNGVYLARDSKDYVEKLKYIMANYEKFKIELEKLSKQYYQSESVSTFLNQIALL